MGSQLSQNRLASRPIQASETNSLVRRQPEARHLLKFRADTVHEFRIDERLTTHAPPTRSRFCHAALRE